MGLNQGTSYVPVPFLQDVARRKKRSIDGQVKEQLSPSVNNLVIYAVGLLAEVPPSNVTDIVNDVPGEKSSTFVYFDGLNDFITLQSLHELFLLLVSEMQTVRRKTAVACCQKTREFDSKKNARDKALSRAEHVAVKSGIYSQEVLHRDCVRADAQGPISGVGNEK